jgi:hypothetical protein
MGNIAMRGDEWLTDPAPSTPSTPATTRAPTQGDEWLTEPDASPPTAKKPSELGWSDIPSSLAQGIQHGISEVGETFGGKGMPAPAGAAPYQWSDVTNPGSFLSKTAYRIGEGSPTLAGGFAGAGVGSLGGPWGGVAGGALGAAAGSALQTLGPAFHAELKATPHDPDGAWDRALRNAMASGAFSGASWAAFPMRFFSGPIKNAAFQIMGVQPGLAAAHQVTQNVMEGNAPLENTLQAATEGAIGAGTGMLTSAVARGAGRAAGRAMGLGDQAARSVAQEGPTTPEQLYDVAKSHYSDIDGMNIKYTDYGSLKNLQNSIRNKLFKLGADPRDNPRVFSAISGLTESRYPEAIKSAAIKIGDDIFEGDIHADAALKASEVHGESVFDGIEENEGFMTTKGRFVDREEAMKIAKQQQQIQKDISQFEKDRERAGVPNYLFSEDIGSGRRNWIVDFTDINHVRQRLNNALSDNDPSTKRAAAAAIGELDRWIDNPDAQINAGVDPEVAHQIADKSKMARSYWHAYKAAEAWQQVQDRIELSTNPQRALRSEIEKIVKNPKAHWQYPPEAIELMRDSLRPDFISRISRYTNMFAPHSATGLIADFMLHHFTGPMGLAAPIIAELIRHRANAKLQHVPGRVESMISAKPTGVMPTFPGTLGRTRETYTPLRGPVVYQPQQEQSRGGKVKRALVAAKAHRR